MAKLYFRYSAMNAGKSAALLIVAHNYEEQDREVMVFTAQIDDRYGAGKVTSRMGLSRDAAVFNVDTDFETLLGALLAKTPKLSCILVDEAQFLTEYQVTQLHRFAHLRDVPVICYGLRSDFQGKPFPGAAALLALADTLEELATVCGCGKKARMNVRVDERGNRVTEGNQVEIGGNNRYRQMCARCFYRGDA